MPFKVVNDKFLDEWRMMQLEQLKKEISQQLEMMKINKIFEDHLDENKSASDFISDHLP